MRPRRPDPAPGALLGEAQEWKDGAAFLITAEASCTSAAEDRLPADVSVPVTQPSVDVAALVIEDLDALDLCLRDPGPSLRAQGATTAQDPHSATPTGPEGAPCWSWSAK